MAKAELTVTIERNAATQNTADNKLETAMIRYVLQRVPDVRAVRRVQAGVDATPTLEFSEYDFYLRDEATGAVLQTQGGKDRIRTGALQSAVTRLMREHFKAIVNAQIATEEAAANKLALEAKIAADD